MKYAERPVVPHETITAKSTGTNFEAIRGGGKFDPDTP
jgi:hypothetical protein